MLDALKRLTKDGLSNGFYTALITAVDRSFRRAQVKPEWCDDALEHVRRISDPVLDTVPAVGTRVAIVNQDGVAEAPAYVGAVWDDQTTAANMTAWLRAHLAKHPGHLELGATKGLRLRVGTNDVEITPLPDGRLLIEATGDVIVSAPAVRLGTDSADDGVVRRSDLQDALSEVSRQFAQHVHTVPNAGTTSQPVVPFSATARASMRVFSS